MELCSNPEQLISNGKKEGKAGEGNKHNRKYGEDRLGAQAQAPDHKIRTTAMG